MIDTVKNLIGKNAKAIAAYLAVLVTGLAAHFTLAIPDDVLLAGQSLIVAVIVWITANRE